MGEAKRRKLQGTYPDGSKPKPMEADAPRSLLTETKVCTNCDRAGGTLSSRDGKLVHVPDCDHAAAARMRMADRQERWLARKMKERVAQRRWPQSEPATRVGDEEESEP